MRKYLQFMKYAFKEQRQYRTNFFASIATMIFNDACWVALFLVFLSYFTGTEITFGNFLVIYSITCIWYGVVHGLLNNISGLNDIIEKGKLDYYLSFPVKPLGFLSFTKIGVTDLGDIVFGTICLFIYAFVFADSPAGVVLLKGFAIFILASMVSIGIYIAIGSISFWLQKGSKVQDLLNSILVSFSGYPPEIYEGNRFIYIFMCLILFPSTILPYKMILGTTTLWQWALMVIFAIIIPLIGIWIFKRGLKRYSSGNLVHQM